MAENTTKKSLDNATSTKRQRVEVKLPRLQGQNANQQEFFMVNGRTCLIERGVYVEVAPEVEEVIRNSVEADEAALRFVEGLEKATKEKEKELGL